MNKTHRPCLILAIVASLGICAGKYLALPVWFWFFVSAWMMISFLMYRRTWIIVLAVFSVAALGCCCQYILAKDSIAFINSFNRYHFESIEGTIDSDIRQQNWARGQKEVFDLKVNRILIDGKWRQSSGKVQVNLYMPLKLNYGQTLRLQGKMHLPFEGKDQSKFSYRQYLREQGIYWILSVNKEKGCEILLEHGGNAFVATALRMRAYIVDIFSRYLDPREAGFVAAIVVGDRSSFPKDLKEIFVNTGTAHILAISGMNMTIVTALFFFILRLCALPRRWQFTGTIIFLFIYAFISGWSPSVVRACLMSAVMLASFAFEYESDALNSLGVAALILFILDPKNLFDIGFQLSFAAVAGILILYPYCQKIFKWLPTFLGNSMAVSLSAWIATEGIILYYFHIIAPISIIANVPIVPLADLIMALGLGLVIVATICPPLAYAFAACLKAILSALILLATWFSEMPWGHFIYG